MNRVVHVTSVSYDLYTILSQDSRFGWNSVCCHKLLVCWSSCSFFSFAMAQVIWKGDNRPTYPSIFVWKSAGSTDVRAYFSKYGQRVSRKYGKYSWSIQWVLIGQKVFKTLNIDFAFKALWKLAIFRYCGFEFEAVGAKWLHENNEEEEECKKPRKQAPTRQQPFKKGCIGISERSIHSALLLEKVFCSLWSRTTLADVNKIKASQCHSVPVL